MTQPRTFFMLLTATRHWRELGPAARREVFDETLVLVFNGFPALRMSLPGRPKGSLTAVRSTEVA
jgi:hypothetical protein